MTAIHWLNPISDSFTNAADWSGGVVPAATDDAILDAAGGNFTVKVEVAEIVNSVQLAANATLSVFETSFTASQGTGAGANAGTILLSGYSTLTVDGVVNNTGAIDLNGKNRAARLDIGSAGVSLTGGGTVTLSDVGGDINQVYIEPGASLTNVDNTLSGSGLVEVSLNESGGVIDATGAHYALIARVDVNQGLIELTGGPGLVLEGTVLNTGGVILNASLSGAVIQGGSLSGVFVNSGQLSILDGSNSPVTNNGVIGDFGTLGLMGTIHNEGTVRTEGVLLVEAPHTSLTGQGMVTGEIAIFAAAAGDALINVNNTIVGFGEIGGALTFVNQANGVIEGHGLFLETSGAVMTNAGLIESSAGNQTGLTIASMTIANGTTGIIRALNKSEILLTAAHIRGGTLQAIGSGRIFVSTGDTILDGRTNPLNIQATVTVGNTRTLTVEGALVNSGAISLVSGAFSGDLIVGAAGATLSGGGSVKLGGSMDVVVGEAPGASLINVDNVISGAGDLGGGQMKLVNRAGGVIEATQAAPLTLDTGAQTIANAGLIEALGPTAQCVIASAVQNGGTLEAAAGTLIVEGAVTGKGGAVISAGVLAFASSFDEAVAFTGTAGALELAQSQSFGGLVSGFSTAGGTSLDLVDIGFVSADEATFSGTARGGTLTVTDGVHTASIRLKGDYLQAVFTASGDGGGGTSIVATVAGVAAPPPHAFVSAMASVRGSSGEAVAVGHDATARESALARPHAIA